MFRTLRDNLREVEGWLEETLYQLNIGDDGDSLTSETLERYYKAYPDMQEVEITIQGILDQVRAIWTETLEKRCREEAENYIRADE